METEILKLGEMNVIKIEVKANTLKDQITPGLSVMKASKAMNLKELYKEVYEVFKQGKQELRL